jgi:hypothetical protein
MKYIYFQKKLMRTSHAEIIIWMTRDEVDHLPASEPREEMTF